MWQDGVRETPALPRRERLVFDSVTGVHQWCSRRRTRSPVERRALSPPGPFEERRAESPPLHSVPKLRIEAVLYQPDAAAISQ